MTESKLIYSSELFADGKRATRQRPDRSWIEPSRELPVFAECDVLVVGGGPAGTTAAIGAARLGANVILLERYNHLGGLSTGGLVFWIDRMTDWQGQLVIRGLAEEIFDHLPKEYVKGPAKTEWGSRDAATAAYWSSRLAAFHGIVTWSPMVCPEKLKHVSTAMVEAAGARLVLHCWVSAPIIEDNCVKGVVFECKEGRQALFAKVVVDATGDGDLFHRGGAASVSDIDAGSFHSSVNTAWTWGGVDMKAWAEFRSHRAEEFGRFMAHGREQIGTFDRPFAAWRDDVALFLGPRLVGYDPSNVEDLTSVDVRSRELMWSHLEIYRARAPGFKNAFVISTASQTGIRHTRRLAGIAAIERSRWNVDAATETEIGISPSLSPKFSNISVPYGAMIPQSLDGLIAPGRHLSCDATSHSFMREIPQCWMTGHAAGVAAAICAAAKVQPRSVDVSKVQQALIQQGANIRARGNIA